MIPSWLVTTKWFSVECLATGPDPNRDRIVFIAGCAKVPGRSSVTAVASLVNPGIPIPPDATVRHGISDELVKNAPKFDRILPTLLKISKGHVAAAFSGKWTLGLVRAEMKRLGHPTRQTSPVDPLVWAWELDPSDDSPWAWTLEATCARWSVDIKREAHGVLAHALACWDLWWAIVSGTQDLMPTEFADMLKLQRRLELKQAVETYSDKFLAQN